MSFLLETGSTEFHSHPIRKPEPEPEPDMAGKKPLMTKGLCADLPWVKHSASTVTLSGRLMLERERERTLGGYKRRK